MVKHPTKNLSLKQLRVFITITQHETLTEAAEILCLSKAAVSMSLSELEKHLGHALFDRVNHRLILNQEGQTLLPLADELIKRSFDIEQLFDNPNQLSGQLRIGASDTIGNHVAPYLLSAFRHRHHHQSQTIFISNSALICDKLLDYELDIALIEGKSRHQDLVSTPFIKDEMCLVCSPAHPAAHASTINLLDLEQSAWLLREPGSGSREFFLRRIAPQLEQWHEAFELNTTEAIINGVSANLGFACLSTLAAQSALNDGRIVKLPVKLEMQRQFWLLIHKEKYQSPLLKRFIEFCLYWSSVESNALC
jgi:DNA-binding transcriptional LysR family regulator